MIHARLNQFLSNNYVGTLLNVFVRSIGRAREVINLAESIRYVRRMDIRSGQNQIRKLKARVDELSEQLRSLEVMSDAVGVNLSGPGPFRMPLLSRLKSLHFTEMERQLVPVFELPDGRLVYAIFTYLVAAQIVNGDASVPLQRALVPSTGVEFKKAGNAFKLSFLSCYEGYFYSNCERVLVFLTDEGQTVFISLPNETYKNLLRKCEAALVTYMQSTEVSFGVQLRFPIKSRQ